MSTSRGLSADAVRPMPDLLADPATVDLDALGWLDPLVDGARVVAVGESSHFDSESFRLRHLLLRFLVERHGFTAHVVESGFVEGWDVDAWLDRPAGPESDAALGAVLAGGLTSSMGMFVEQRRLLAWMRSTPTRPRFYGMDLPGSGVSLLPALDLVGAYLERHDPDLRVDPGLRELAAVGAASSVFAAQYTAHAFGELPPERRDALTAGLSVLRGRLRARRPLQHPDHDVEFDRAEQALASAIALDAYRRSMAVNVRDLAQADTVEWVLRREERIVLAAHNGHVQRWPMEFPGVLPPAPTTGQHLARRLGDRYRVVGVTTGSGQALTSGADFFEGRFFAPLPPPPDGTLDAVMAATHSTPFGVDLHRLDDDDRAVVAAVREQRSGEFICAIDPLTAYDAVIHLPRVSPAHLDPAAVTAAPPEVAEAFRQWPAAG